MISTILRSKWTKAPIFVVCLIPAYLMYQRIFQSLIPPAVETVEQMLGDWTIWFLGITLMITPVRSLLNQPLLIRYRRMLGLFAFFYGCLHFATWLWLDKDWDLHEMWADILKRKYVTVGMLGWVLMIPLAVTSTAWAVRKLGFKNWQSLHRLIYASATLGVIHYYWLVKSDIRLPVLYGAILFALLCYRVIMWSRRRPSRTPRQTFSQPVIPRAKR